MEAVELEGRGLTRLHGVVVIVNSLAFLLKVNPVVEQQVQRKVHQEEVSDI